MRNGAIFSPFVLRPTMKLAEVWPCPLLQRIDGVEADQRHEQRAALDFEQAKLLARQADDAAEAHPLQRRDRDAIAALPAGLSEELPENLVLIGTGVEQRSLRHAPRAPGRCRN